MMEAIESKTLFFSRATEDPFLNHASRLWEMVFYGMNESIYFQEGWCSLCYILDSPVEALAIDHNLLTHPPHVNVKLYLKADTNCYWTQKHTKIQCFIVVNVWLCIKNARERMERDLDTSSYTVFLNTLQSLFHLQKPVQNIRFKYPI